MKARINSLYITYADIAFNSYKEYSDFVPEIVEDEGNKYTLNSEILIQACIKIIVFSALALEAFSYEILCHLFSDSIAMKHLEKLNVDARFILAEKFSKKNLSSNNNHWHELIIKLNRTRNLLVHAKSESITFSDFDQYSKIAKKYDFLNNPSYITPDYSMKALFLTDDEIKYILPDIMFHPLLSIDNRLVGYRDTEHKIKLRKKLFNK